MSSESPERKPDTMSQNKPLNPYANPFQIPSPRTREKSGTSLLSTPTMNYQQTTTLAPNYPILQQNALLVCPSYYHGGIGYIIPGILGPAYQVSIPVLTSISQTPPTYQNLDQFPIDPLPSNDNSNREFGEGEIYGTMGNEAEMGGQMQSEWIIKRNYRVDDVPFPVTLEESESSGTTTLMIRNIPNTIKLKDLLLLLDDHCCEQNKTIDDHTDWSMFDVLYVPMDFRKHAKRGKVSNLGYGFVNFTTPKAAFKFYQLHHGNGWHGHENKDNCMITSAHIQGKDALVDEFSRKVFRCKSRDFLPVVFSDPRNGFNRESEGTPLGRFVEGAPRRALPSWVSPTTNESTPTSSSSHPSSTSHDDVDLISGRIASVSVSHQLQSSNPSPSEEENISA